MNRKALRDGSNNPDNPNKNLCGYAVARALGVEEATRYIHTISDLQRAIRSMWSLRSVKTKMGVKAGRTTVGAIRKRIAAKGEALAYLVHVEGHVLLLDKDGSTSVDTAPVQRDRRKVLRVQGVYMSENDSKFIKMMKLKEEKLG
tara:strand:+ start:193 stop:627 length:435 start_codon:yes stop_codon:yes gene_type:complete